MVVDVLSWIRDILTVLPMIALYQEREFVTLTQTTINFDSHNDDCMKSKKQRRMDHQIEEI